MLLLVFETHDGRFALEASLVVEVLPLLQLKKIPQSSSYVAGLMNLRGMPVPVFDLCALSGQAPCRLRFSTRIIVIRYPMTSGDELMVGLIAEGVTETIRCSGSEARTPNKMLIEAPQLEGASPEHENEMIQSFEIKKLLPEHLVTEVLNL